MSSLGAHVCSFAGYVIMRLIYFRSHLEETLRNRHNRIGSKFYKYVYKRYTDNTYSKEIKSPRYQGFVGPLLHAELGDVLRIHLRSLVHAPISIHPHGALYNKLNEGMSLKSTLRTYTEFHSQRNSLFKL